VLVHEPVIEQLSVGLRRLPCIAHTMQLVLKEIDKNDEYKNLIMKARAIVKSASLIGSYGEVDRVVQ